MKKLFPILGIFFLAGCTQTNFPINKNPINISSSSQASGGVSSTFNKNISSSNSSFSQSSIEAAKRALIIQFLGSQQQNEMVLDGEEKIFSIKPDSKKQVVLKANLIKGEKISFDISAPNSKEVLRLSTIEYDGETDGPFGPQSQFEAKNNGEYTFTFSPNNMASNEHYSGDYKIKILLK